jgi:Porin subfamily
LGSLQAGLSDTYFGTVSDGGVGLIAGGMDDSVVLPIMAYTVQLGSSSLTLSLEQGDYRTNSGSDTSVAQHPDVVANWTTKFGDATFSARLADHNLKGSTGGNTEGFAVGGAVSVDVTAQTNVQASATYANGAVGYLGAASQGTAFSVSDYSGTSSSGSLASGYNAYVGLTQAAGPGNVMVAGSAASVNAAWLTNNVNTYAAELGYDYKGIKGFHVIPDIYYTNVNNGTTTASVTGYLRITREF